MDALLNLKRNKGAVKSRKRVGRGPGSTFGKTAGRGENGQKSRTGGNIRPGFAGGGTPLYRKMPKLKGFNNPNRINYQPVNVDQLNVFDDNAEIDIIKLYEQKLISKKDQPVKILGTGEITKKLNVKVTKISASAKDKIEKAGGKVTELAAPKAAPKEVATEEK